MTMNEILIAIDVEVRKLQQVRTMLSDYTDPTTVKRGPGRPKSSFASRKSVSKKRSLSSEAREKIAAAQRKRWAAARKKTT